MSGHGRDSDESFGLRFDSVRTDIAVKRGVRDIYTIFDTRWRDRTIELSNALTWPIRPSPLGFIEGSGVVFTERPARIIEMQIMGPFFFVNAGALAGDKAIYLGIEELSSQAAVTGRSERYHFDLVYNAVTAVGSLVITDLAQTYAQVIARPRKVRPPAAAVLNTYYPPTQPGCNKYIFGEPGRVAKETITMRFSGWLGPLIPTMSAGSTLSPPRDYFDAGILWGTVPFTLTVPASVLGTINLALVGLVSFDNFLSSSFSVSVGPDVNPFHPHNAWVVTGYTAPAGTTPALLELGGLDASTQYTTAISAGLATDVNRPGDAALIYPGPVIATVTYSNPAVFTISSTVGLATGVTIIFTSFALGSGASITQNMLMSPTGFPITVLSSTQFSIPFDLTGVRTADRVSTATYILFRRPTVRIFICDRQYHTRIPMRFRLTIDETEERRLNVVPNGVAPV